MKEETGPPACRLANAIRAASLGAAAGAVLGFLDALRSRLDPASVLPPSESWLAVLLYAGVSIPPAALAGAVLAPATAAALVVAGSAALGAGLAANYWFLPAFTDPLSLAADGVMVAFAAAGAWALRRRFLERGTPRAGAAFLAALAASFLLAVGGGRSDGPAPSARRSAEGPGPDVLLVLVDTLRADAISVSGAPGAAPTPAMEGLAKEGTAFLQCRAPSSWTKPSTASLLTGLYPSEHGALGFESVVPGEAVTLAEVLRAAGWRTAAFADNPFVSPEFGFAQGFDAFTGRHPSPLARGTLLLRAAGQVRLRLAGGAAYSFGPGVDLGADRVLGDAAAFLAAGDGKRPGFAYCHLIEPHFPYTPPPAFSGARPRIDPPHSSGILPFDSFPDISPADAAAMKANYLGEARGVDAALGRMLEGLRSSGRLDRTLVVLTSDHGEEFHEHGGWTHGQSLYEELVRVPLVIRAPGGSAGRRVEAPVSLVDVVPTILDLAGVASSARPSGRSLVPLLRGEKVEPRPLFSEIAAGPVGARAVFLGNRALIASRKAGREIVQEFDLATDPLETRSLPAGAALRGLLDRAFRDMEAGGLRREDRAFDEETRKVITTLGYGGR